MCAERGFTQECITRCQCTYNTTEENTRRIIRKRRGDKWEQVANAKIAECSCEEQRPATKECKVKVDNTVGYIHCERKRKRFESSRGHVDRCRDKKKTENREQGLTEELRERRTEIESREESGQSQELNIYELQNIICNNMHKLYFLFIFIVISEWVLG